MPTDYFEDSRTFSERHGYTTGYVVSDAVASFGWSDSELEPEIDIKIKKDTEYCYVCNKKHGKRTYEVKTAYTGKKKVCSNCKFIYDILKREIIDNDNVDTINYIHNTLASIKITMLSKEGEQ